MSAPLANAGLFDNVLSDYLWARAVLLVGERPHKKSNAKRTHTNVPQAREAFSTAQQSQMPTPCLHQPTPVSLHIATSINSMTYSILLTTDLA